MANSYLLLVIICMGLITFFLRAIPFVLMEFFKHHPIVRYLGGFLPGIVMLILIVFSVKHAHYIHYPYGIPELGGIAATALLHLWRRNIFISIVGGTAAYALLHYFL